MKKILCLIDALRSGGAERQMIGLYTLLRSRGYKVDFATYLPSNFYTDFAKQNEGCFIFLEAKTNKLSKFLAVRQCVKKGGYDVIIAYKDGATMLACLLKLSGCHVSVIVSERVTTQRLTLRDRAKFFLYRFADYIVPNSYSQEKFINRNYPHLSAKVQTITNFTDTDSFTPQDIAPHNPLVILTVARIAEQKNIKRYLQAIKILKESHIHARFVWYGREEEKQYARDCYQLILDLDIADMVSFLPPTSEIINEYHKCDIFCLPSVYEGYPNVICEAMSCGKPILCSHICDNPQIVEDGTNGLLFDPMDVDDMVDKIAKLCNASHEERQEMGNYNRITALRKFSKDAFVDKYIELIE